MAKLAGLLKIYSHMEMSMSNLSSKVWRLQMEKEREKKLPTRNRNASFGPFTNLHTTHTRLLAVLIYTHIYAQ